MLAHFITIALMSADRGAMETEPMPPLANCEFSALSDASESSPTSASVESSSREISLPERSCREIFTAACSIGLDHFQDLHTDDIVGRTFGEQRIYNTKSHNEIYSVLLGHLKNLKDGKYVGMQGVSCSMLVGAKGIGKTACFKTFTYLAPFIRPYVFVSYVSYNSASCVGSRLSSKSLAMILSEELGKCGIEIAADNQSLTYGERLVEALKTADRYLLVLVDELDQLYRVDGSKNPSALATLSDLAYLGNQPSGRISVLACGSSALMENLITTNCNDQIRADFSLLSTGAINLNCTKYRTKRVYSMLPMDLKAVASIVDKLEGTYEDNLPYYRLVAYLTGCSARNVERFINDTDDDGLVSGSRSLENSLTGSNNLTNSDISSLRDAIFKALRKKNRALLVTLFGASTCSSADIVRNIALTNWEDLLKPLEYAEVELVWRRLERKKKVYKDNRRDLCYYILHLTDRSWLTLSGVKDSKPELIYPSSLQSLGATVLSTNGQDDILKKVLNYSRDGLAIQHLLGHPRFVARRAPVNVAAVCTIL